MIKNVSLCALLVLGAAAGAHAAQRRSIRSAYAALMRREAANGTMTPSGDRARRDLPYANWSGSYDSVYSSSGYSSSGYTSPYDASSAYSSYAARLALRHRLAKYRRRRFYSLPTPATATSQSKALSSSATDGRFASRLAPHPRLARTKRLGQ